MDILFSSSMFTEFALLAQMNVVVVTLYSVDRRRCVEQLGANSKVGSRLKACRRVLNTIFSDPDDIRTYRGFISQDSSSWAVEQQEVAVDMISGLTAELRDHNQYTRGTPLSSSRRMQRSPSVVSPVSTSPHNFMDLFMLSRLVLQIPSFPSKSPPRPSFESIDDEDSRTPMPFY